MDRQLTDKVAVVTGANKGIRHHRLRRSQSGGREPQQVLVAGIRGEADPYELRLTRAGQHRSLAGPAWRGAAFADATGVDDDTIRVSAAAALATGSSPRPKRSRRWSRCSRPIAPRTSPAPTT